MKAAKEHKPQQSRVIQSLKNSLISRISHGIIKYKQDSTPEQLCNYILNTNCIKANDIIQRRIANAQYYRILARMVTLGVNANFANRTVAVSNNYFAVTPLLGGRRQIRRGCLITRRIYAPPVPNAVFRYGNHAERKLIAYDNARREIGVTRDICQQCVNAICNDHNNLEHVSQYHPNYTYVVTPHALVAVAH